VLVDGKGNIDGLIILAHGAGAPMDSDFMNNVSRRFAQRYTVWRFEFPYMAARRDTGKRRPPDREPVLLQAWREVVQTANHEGWRPERIAIGGKSMGGRMASLVADELAVGYLICLGYPFHPPGKPDKRRTEHLAALQTPTLICQGERDPFGTREEVSRYALSEHIHFAWAADGNHDLKPRRASGRAHEDNLAEASAAVLAFLA